MDRDDELRINAAWSLVHSLPDNKGICLHKDVLLSDGTNGSRVCVWNNVRTKNNPDLIGKLEGVDDTSLLNRAFTLAMEAE